MRFLLALLFPLAAFAQDATLIPSAREWTTVDRALMATSTMLLIMDWGQTRYIAKSPGPLPDGTLGYRPPVLYETNPLLGKRPSVGKVDLYFTAALAGNFYVADSLNSDERKLWLGAVSLIEYAIVRHNRQLGIKIAF